MATLYWGPSGGTSTGTWDETTTTNWFTNLARTTPAGAAPTSADDVVFDASSDNGAPFTVTLSGLPVCRDITISGLDQTMTLAGTPTRLDIYGSLLWPATNLARTFAAPIYFKATTTGKTITTNGVNITTSSNVIFDGVGGEWTLGSALSFGTPTSQGATIDVVNGTFKTGNYNITAGVLSSNYSSTRGIYLGSSTVSLRFTTALNFTTSTNLTFDAGTSTIDLTQASFNFYGGGQTFYILSLSGTTANSSGLITGTNTFTTLTITTPATAIRRIAFGNNQTVTGTLTAGAANTAIRRVCLRSDTVGTQRTLTVATLAALADVDFQDINAAGASAPWSGTRIGDCGGNTGITVTAASDKYWYSATGAGGNWSAAQWETTSGGTSPSVNNFPLPQDTVKFQNTGLTTGNTLTIDAAWNLPAIDGTSRTNAMTLASGAQTPTIFGDLTIVSVMTITGTGSWKFSKQGTQNITTNGVSVTWPVAVENGTGSFKLLDNLTVSNTGTQTTGGIDLNNKTFACTTFTSGTTSTRSLAFGTTGQFSITGNNAIVWTTTAHTGFSYTGTSKIVLTYSGSTGTRILRPGVATQGATESTALNFQISAGTDTVSLTGNSGTNVLRSVDSTGFSGTISATGVAIYYGDLTLSATTTWAPTTGTLFFAATSGTQNITTNGVAIDAPILVNTPGATVKLIDALTIGSTRTFTLTAGTLDLNDKTLTCAIWESSFSNTRAISFGTTGQISVEGSNALVFSFQVHTGFSFTGTSKIVLTYSGNTGTRTLRPGLTANGAGETTAMNLYVSAGTDTVSLGGNTGNNVYRSIDTTGFSGSLSLGNTIYCYGNFTIASTTTYAASAAGFNFRATSGTQVFTTNGVTINSPVTVACPGATVEAQDAITLGAYTFSQTAGTLKLKAGTTNTANAWSFAGTVSTPIVLESTLGGTRATISQASGTVNSNYLTVKDIAVTGGATFNAFTGSGSSTSANNVNNGNNLGWYFIPPGATFAFFF